MKKTIFICLFLVFNSISAPIAGTLPKPWIKYYSDNNIEGWYDPATVNKAGSYIKVNVIEIEIHKAIITTKDIIFDKSTGFKRFGKVAIYKNQITDATRVSSFDFSANDSFIKPYPEENKLFRAINSKALLIAVDTPPKSDLKRKKEKKAKLPKTPAKQPEYVQAKTPVAENVNIPITSKPVVSKPANLIYTWEDEKGFHSTNDPKDVPADILNKY